jgi:hypothetical protein
MSDFSISPSLYSALGSSSLNTDIFSILSSSSSSAASFPQGISSDSDFAKLLVNQIQNNSLKILGSYSENDQSKSSGSNYAQLFNNNFSSSDFSSNSVSGENGLDFLNTSLDSTDDTDNIFSTQMISLMQMSQIKVFQGLVGKKVRAKDTDGNEITGVVENITMENNQFLLMVGGKKVKPESILEVLIG